MKKSQSSIEFMTLLLFVVVLIALATYVVGFASMDIRKNQLIQERESFANLILNEFEIANSVEGGYFKEIRYSNVTMDRFNVTFNYEGDYLVLQDLDVFLSMEDEVFFYSIPLSEDISYYYNDSTNVLSISKQERTFINYLELN